MAAIVRETARAIVSVFPIVFRRVRDNGKSRVIETFLSVCNGATLITIFSATYLAGDLVVPLHEFCRLRVQREVRSFS